MKMLQIFKKDSLQALQNVQLLVALALPFALGVLYNVVYPDTTQKPEVRVAYVAVGHTDLPAIVTAATRQTARVSFQRLTSAAQVRQRVTQEKVDIGIVLPQGFDRAVRSGQAPNLLVIVREGSSAPPDYVAASLEPSLRQMAGQSAPATVERQVVPARTGSISKVMDEVGARKYMVLAAVIILISMISVYMVPVLITEETEKRTMDALVMIASYVDVIGAKALVGFLYIAVGVPVLLLMTGLRPANLPLFAAGVLGFGVSMVGLGLLMGGLFRTTAQLNTWSGVALLPLIFAATLTGVDLPKVFQVMVGIMPSSRAVQLAIDGLGGQSYFGDALLSMLILAIWTIGAYGALWWRLQHREI